MNTPHPHADILRAIADGAAKLEDIEARFAGKNACINESAAWYLLKGDSPYWTFKIRPPKVRVWVALSCDKSLETTTEQTTAESWAETVWFDKWLINGQEAEA
jgi:hypothetical protein